MNDICRIIDEGKASLGIEFGSTRIKAVLLDDEYKVIQTGTYDWENELVNDIWTYSEKNIIEGLQKCYADLAGKVNSKYGVVIHKLAALGISGMMHGYMVFDEKDNLLVPFRTWRNTMTGEASAKLTKEFNFHVPQRYSIAHLYQAILNGEEHVRNISYMTTLAGFIHWKLSGEKNLGVGEASGMFPVRKDSYDREKIQIFNNLIKNETFAWKLEDILPEIRMAGEEGGFLSEAGAGLLDPSGNLSAGIFMCPPEGDAQTGMCATNSIARRTGNVSAGTSVFAMVVMDEPLKKNHEEIDVVSTPDGNDVAMVHCNNCSSDLNDWVGLFKEFSALAGFNLSQEELFTLLFNCSIKGASDCGGLLSCNYLSGEHITGMEEGRPLFVRNAGDDFSLANFMKLHIYSAFATLKIGMDILLEEEQVKIDRIYGHGGIFKTPKVAQQILADAIDAPVSVMKTAGEGGAYGMALLAVFADFRRNNPGEKLADFLNDRIFSGNSTETAEPDEKGTEGFKTFINGYKQLMPVEKAAIFYTGKNNL